MAWAFCFPVVARLGIAAVPVHAGHGAWLRVPARQSSCRRCPARSGADPAAASTVTETDGENRLRRGRHCRRRFRPVAGQHATPAPHRPRRKLAPFPRSVLDPEARSCPACRPLPSACQRHDIPPPFVPGGRGQRELDACRHRAWPRVRAWIFSLVSGDALQPERDGGIGGRVKRRMAQREGLIRPGGHIAIASLPACTAIRAVRAPPTSPSRRTTSRSRKRRHRPSARPAGPRVQCLAWQPVSARAASRADEKKRGIWEVHRKNLTKKPPVFWDRRRYYSEQREHA